MSPGGLPQSDLKAALRLIVITDEKLAGSRGVLPTVQEALKGGCRAIQMRAKGMDAAGQIELGRALRTLTRDHDALLFVNDRADVAAAIEADGVHLGPDDLPVASVRAAFPSLLIGYSTDDPFQARRAVDEGADHLGCGAVFGTTSKDVGGEAIGLDRLRTVAEAVDIPVVGIGGITPDRAAAVRATGAVGSAVIGAVMAAGDPRAAAETLLS